MQLGRLASTAPLARSSDANVGPVGRMTALGEIGRSFTGLSLDSDLGPGPAMDTVGRSFTGLSVDSLDDGQSTSQRMGRAYEDDAERGGREVGKAGVPTMERSFTGMSATSDNQE